MMAYLQRIFIALTRRERKVFVTAATVSVISAIGFLGTVIHATTEVVPEQGGKYTEGIVGQPTFVNPALSASQVDKSLVRLLFAPVTVLAETIESDETGREVKVRLREGLTWSNGQEITTDDIIFTVERMQDPDTRSPFFSTWQGVSAFRGSKLEVTFRLAAPYAFFEESLEDLFVLPKHLFAEVPSPNWRLSDYNLQPVGSGPYTFVSYEKKPNGFITHYRLAKNARYAGDTPLIDRFEIRFFSQEEELIRSFNTGQIDGFGILSPHVLARINRPYETTSFPSLASYAVFWNQSQNLPLQAPEVRFALALAANREDIISQALLGYGDPITGPFPALLTPPSDAEESYEPDPHELLEDNRWRVNEEGVREKTIQNAVIKLSFNLTVPDIPFLTRTATILEQAWETLGADVELVIVPPASALDIAVKNREYHAVLFGNNIRKDGDLFPFWHSSERFYPGLNLSLYNDEDVDALIETVRQSPDPEERQESKAALARIISTDNPAVFLYSPHYLYVASKDVRGIVPRPLEDFADRFNDVEAWHLRTARVLK